MLWWIQSRLSRSSVSGGSTSKLDFHDAIRNKKKYFSSASLLSFAGYRFRTSKILFQSSSETLCKCSEGVDGNAKSPASYTTLNYLSLQNGLINVSELLPPQESNWSFAVEALVLFKSHHMKSMPCMGEKLGGDQPWKKSQGFQGFPVLFRHALCFPCTPSPTSFTQFCLLALSNPPHP